MGAHICSIRVWAPLMDREALSQIVPYQHYQYSTSYVTGAEVVEKESLSKPVKVPKYVLDCPLHCSRRGSLSLSLCHSFHAGPLFFFAQFFSPPLFLLSDKLFFIAHLFGKSPGKRYHFF